MSDSFTTKFSLINTSPFTFKVEPPVRLPWWSGGSEFLEVDMALKLVSGKWPLSDDTDCNGCHTFVFQKPDGEQFSMPLDGFTWDCEEPLLTQQGNIDEHNYPTISLLINGTIYNGKPYNYMGVGDTLDEDADGQQKVGHLYREVPKLSTALSEECT